MPKYAHPDVLDNGPAFIKANAQVMMLISGYAFGDSYTTVNNNRLAQVGVQSTELVITNNGNDRRLATPAGKSANAAFSSGASPDLHIAFIDAVNSKVLWVTDETSNQVITAGNPVDFPVLTYNSAQPV